MPKNPDYSKCQIYKLVCKDLAVTDCYVGSTCSWIRRKSQHKNDIINKNDKAHNYKKAVIIRNNGGWENWEMVLIENYPCKNDLEARSKEREWLEKLGATMNSQTPLRTQEDLNKSRAEYRAEHRDELNAKAAEYHAAHRDECNAKCLIANSKKMTCACGAEHVKGNKLQHIKSKKHTDWVKANETKSNEIVLDESTEI
jgi:hypothetical protein